MDLNHFGLNGVKSKIIGNRKAPNNILVGPAVAIGIIPQK
jgi:hypothetical protein